LSDFNFKLTILSIAGIPLQIINTVMPIKYHIIKNTSKDTYDVELPLEIESSDKLTIGGGSDITVAKVISIDQGYPFPNHYKISLGKVFENIISAKMVSSEIPNTGKVININNNKIYWNNLDDGDTLYHITVPPGNYTTKELEHIMNKLFDDIIVDINESTYEVTFESYKKISLSSTQIKKMSKGPSGSLNCILTINLPNCDFDNGTKIKINKKIFGILHQGENSNEYHIHIDNPIDINESICIYVPNIFRLRFDQPNTLGSILGFRDPGCSTSITPYASKQSNQNYYEYQIRLEKMGLLPKDPKISNSLQLNGEPYIIMVINEIKTFTTLGKIKDAFAKIQLCGKHDKILFNTFVNTFHVFNDPLNELSELTISFYNPDGTLYDFHGADHSFTLELVTVSDIPEGTGLSTNTGKNYNTEIG
ncbi:MAG: hypothetical protein MUO21_02320, partial [Nitrososphaeraceae archaeon]|nr:hypothetical protein [Nitrososphaeraceae archaeon]